MRWKTLDVASRTRVAGLTLAVLAGGAAQAAASRCGWVDNPTPGNWSLTDREGEWTIGSQGGFQAEGMELIPDLTAREWVESNGSYGYGCACMSVETTRRTMRIVEVQGVAPSPISNAGRIRGCRGGDGNARTTDSKPDSVRLLLGRALAGAAFGGAVDGRITCRLKIRDRFQLRHVRRRPDRVAVATAGIGSENSSRMEGHRRGVGLVLRAPLSRLHRSGD